jgi:hypothetical protein
MIGDLKPYNSNIQFGTVVFKVESVVKCWREILLLLKAHWEEVTYDPDMLPQPDMTEYECIERGNGLKLFTARDDGKLIGYCIMFINYSMHYGYAKQAVQDLLYIKPEHRGGDMLERFIKHIDAELQAEDVKLVFQMVKPSRDFGKKLLAMGYRHDETVYSRRLS